MGGPLSSRRSTSSFSFRIGKVPALDSLALPAADGDSIRFTIVRDAATVEFRGVRSDSFASGSYVSTPNPDFAPALVALGYDDPTPRDHLARALIGASLDNLRELDKRGLGPVSGYFMSTWFRSGIDRPSSTASGHADTGASV